MNGSVEVPPSSGSHRGPGRVWRAVLLFARCPYPRSMDGGSRSRGLVVRGRRPRRHRAALGGADGALELRRFADAAARRRAPGCHALCEGARGVHRGLPIARARRLETAARNETGTLHAARSGQSKAAGHRVRFRRSPRSQLGRRSPGERDDSFGLLLHDQRTGGRRRPRRASYLSRIEVHLSRGAESRFRRSDDHR